MSRPATQVVLFDLDGTLVDSAPDLAGAVNELRAANGLAAMPLDQLRPLVGSGARGMVGAAFGVTPGDARYASLRDDFLQRYAARLLHLTVVFAAIVPVLRRIEAESLRWGIVTNKALHLAEPIVAGTGLSPRAAVLIAGDSTAHTKPHPAPLLEAARRIGVDPARCVYVGDDIRDMQAGRAAGMATLAAGWGYLGPEADPRAWPADAVLDAPDGLLHWLQLP
jgi:N-acetyl-D-muramate 6-phosphate phosphatase